MPVSGEQLSTSGLPQSSAETQVRPGVGEVSKLIARSRAQRPPSTKVVTPKSSMVASLSTISLTLPVNSYGSGSSTLLSESDPSAA